MCTHNINARNGWVNGTRVRLRASRAWTGATHKIKRSGGQEPRWCAQQVKLDDDKKFPEFNVYVVKDEECSLAKKVRYEDIDVQAIPFRNDASTVGGCFKMWKQVQIIPAYALTAHKGQGLTLSMTFLGLDDIFGFGLAYTMYTRSRYAENMCNVGVPPKDILEALLRRDSNGQNAIDRKRLQVQTLLKDTNAFDAMMDARIESGEFCLKTIATDLALATEPVLAQARAKLREVQGTL